MTNPKEQRIMVFRELEECFYVKNNIERRSKDSDFGGIPLSSLFVEFHDNH